MFARLLNWGKPIPKHGRNRQLKASRSNAANVSLHLLEVANYIYSPPKNLESCSPNLLLLCFAKDMAINKGWGEQWEILNLCN